MKPDIKDPEIMEVLKVADVLLTVQWYVITIHIETYIKPTYACMSVCNMSCNWICTCLLYVLAAMCLVSHTPHLHSSSAPAPPPPG